MKNQITHVVSEQAMRDLKNLLARMHRDGGHHTEEVGLLRSIRDAEDVYLKLREDLQRIRDDWQALTGGSYFVWDQHEGSDYKSGRQGKVGSCFA